jgi:hypothetical protein
MVNSKLVSIVIALILMSVSGSAALSKGCITFYYVVNKSGQPCKVKVWTSEVTLQPDQVGKFRFACWSKLPIEVRKMDGTLTSTHRETGSKIPSDRAAHVDDHFQYIDDGKTSAGKSLDSFLKKLGTAAAAIIVAG